MNEQQKGQMVDKIRDALGGVQGKTIGLLRLSFKPNTDDLRDSPALFIAKHLMKEGCTVQDYDPEGLEGSLRNLTGLVGCEDVYDTAKGADALVLATE